jgi:membrane-associated protease RseP (regulator of RpoE activity)
MFPLLPLDGGHVAIAVYERIRSRRGKRYFADVRKMLPYSAALVMVLGFILVTSVYLDVRQPVNFFP